jgi:mannose-6-phosphate isomerase
MAAARKIAPEFVERPWGKASLAPWFAQEGGRTGEVWFETPELLIKYLFTTEALSVQVHPGDEYARRHENASGKTEMWYVLEAEPGARIALGFRGPVSREQAGAAALDGSIVGLLEWHEASRGDTFFTPAGTVHALGAGLTVLEIQQASDVTYRLYDYGRGRPLHLEKGLAVLDAGPHPGKSQVEPLGDGGELLARCPYFVTELWRLERPREFGAASMMIPIEGAARVAGEPMRVGEVWQLDGAAVVEPADRVTLLRTYAPGR